MWRRELLQCAKTQIRNGSVSAAGAEGKGRCAQGSNGPDQEDITSENQKFILSKCKDSKHEVTSLCDDKKSLEYHIYTGGCINI